MLSQNLLITKELHLKRIICRVTSELVFPDRSQSCFIGPFMVLHPPQVLVYSRSSVLEYHENVQFVCVAKGYPENFTFTWSCLPSGTLNGCNGRSQTVNISLERKLHGSRYPDTLVEHAVVSCTASNSEGSATASAHVRLRYEVSTRKVFHNPVTSEHILQSTNIPTVAHTTSTFATERLPVSNSTQSVVQTKRIDQSFDQPMSSTLPYQHSQAKEIIPPSTLDGPSDAANSDGFATWKIIASAAGGFIGTIALTLLVVVSVGVVLYRHYGHSRSTTVKQMNQGNDATSELPNTDPIYEMPDAPEIFRIQQIIPKETSTYSPIRVCHTYASEVLQSSSLSTLSERSWTSVSDTNGEEIPHLKGEPQGNVNKHSLPAATYENESAI